MCPVQMSLKVNGRGRYHHREQKKVNSTEGGGQEDLKGQQQGCQLSLLVHMETKPQKTTG